MKKFILLIATIFLICASVSAWEGSGWVESETADNAHVRKNLTVDGCIYATCLSGVSGGGGGTVTAVTGSYPISSSGGATPNITVDLSAYPRKGTLTNTKWCSSDGTVINCTENAPVGGGTVTAVTGSYPIASSGGATPNITVDLSAYPRTSRNINTTYPLQGGGNLSADRTLTVDLSNYLQVGSAVTGTGNAGYITRWGTSTSIADSAIYQNGSNIGIGSTSPQQVLDVNGAMRIGGAGDSTIGGNLGIGTASPVAGLQVGVGSSSLSATLGTTSALVKGNLEVDGKIYGDGSALTNLPGGGTVTAVTGTYPIASSGGTTPNITVDLSAYAKTADLGSYLTSVAVSPGLTGDGTGGNPLTVDTSVYARRGTLTNTKWCTSDGTTITCNSDTPGGASADNPTGTVGLTVVNGSASTFLRSDGAPPLSQAISPTWTGNHTFTPASGDTLITAGNVGIGSATPGQKVVVDGGVYLTGNIGIATASPRARLEVNRAATIPAGSNPAALIKGNLVVDGNLYGNGANIVGIDAGGGDITGSLTANKLVKATGTTTISTDTGIYHISPFIGIGIDAPLSTLHIKQGTGTVGAGLTLESTDTAVASGDILGKIIFKAVDAATRIGAFIQAKATGTWQDNDTDNAPTNIEFFTQDSSTSSTLGTPRMAILAAGNIGIGTVTPTAGLMVQVGAGAVDVTGGTVTTGSVGINGKLYVDGGIYGTLWGVGGSGTYGYWSGSGTPVNIFSNNAGNVGIGVSSIVSEKLQVEGKIFLRDGANNVGAGINLPVYGASAAYNIDMVSNSYPPSMTTAAYNVRSGYNPCISLTSGSYNICLGWDSGYYNTTTINSMFAGTFAGVNQTYGDKNYFLGYYNGQFLNDGSTPYLGTEGNTNTNNWYVGSYSTGYANDEANSFNVGNYVKAAGSNATTIGGMYTTKVVFHGNTSGLGSGAMNVGINSRSPLAILDVEGAVYVGSTSGKIGIGTASPANSLHIYTGTTSAGTSTINIESPDTEISNEIIGTILFKGRDSATRIGAKILATATATWDTDTDKAATSLGFYTQADSTSTTLTDPRFLITASGNIGIGSTSPSANLDVDGGVYVQDAANGGIVRLSCFTPGNRLGTCESSSACTTCTEIPNR